MWNGLKKLLGSCDHKNYGEFHEPYKLVVHGRDEVWVKHGTKCFDCGHIFREGSDIPMLVYFVAKEIGFDQAMHNYLSGHFYAQALKEIV